MKTTVRLAGFILVSFWIFISCDAPKKETVVEKQAVEQKDQTLGEEEEPHDHGYEIAMSAYQCPMKCEGDKTYEESGDCPECNMELKKIEVAENSTVKEESTSH